MLGAAGALCCLAAGTAMGSWLKIRRMTRLDMIRAAMDSLNAMRLLLETERLPLPDLLENSTAYTGGGHGAECMRRRFEYTAQQMRTNPLEGIPAAYRAACAAHAAPWEQEEEKAALESLFAQLGCGTAAMREQAAAACIRRLKPVEEKARAEAEKGGKLCIQLGMLTGLVAGIILW
ncbi:MAG: hypothetical protein IKU70_12305 [Clostridia bacterium]|nr:hypothetical protein [Clostridia bacterium]